MMVVIRESNDWISQPLGTWSVVAAKTILMYGKPTMREDRPMLTE